MTYPNVRLIRSSISYAMQAAGVVAAIRRNVLALLDTATSATAHAIATGDAFDIKTAVVSMRTLRDWLKTGDPVQINLLKPWDLESALGKVALTAIVHEVKRLFFTLPELDWRMRLQLSEARAYRYERVGLAAEGAANDPALSLLEYQRWMNEVELPRRVRQCGASA